MTDVNAASYVRDSRGALSETIATVSLRTMPRLFTYQSALHPNSGKELNIGI